MKVLEKGHIYELESFEDTYKQELRFISKQGGTIIHDGTTNEEVLKVLIDRMKTLEAKLPCKENTIILQKLEESLMWMKHRTQRRVEQGVEGKDLPHNL